MLNPEDAKRIETVYYAKSSPQIFIYDCLGDCGKEIRVQKSSLNTRTGYCVKCVKRKNHKPYQQVYNRLLFSAKREGWSCDISYDDFVYFTEIGLCTYCGEVIQWNEYQSGPYNLDRKDPMQGYSLENVVICCGKCNFRKNNFYSFEEFLAIAELDRIWHRSTETERKELMYYLVSWDDKFEIIR